MKKYAVNRLTIEIGRWCNMTCRHCLKGEREKLAFNPKYIDKFLDNISMVNHLYFCGGEASFYIDEMEQILEIFKKKNVPLNYIRVNSNILIRNDKFVDFMNRVGDYSNHPENVKLLISKDHYHLENMRDMGISIEWYEETKQWYKDRLINSVILRENSDPEWRLLLEGKAKNIPLEELKYERLTTIDYDLCKKVTFIPETIKSEGIVLENAFENMTLSAEGYIYFTYDFSYETERQNNYELSIGRTEKDTLENLLYNWNKNADENYTVYSVVESEIQQGMIGYVRQFTDIEKRIEDAVYSNDNEGLLKIKEEIENVSNKFKKELNKYCEIKNFEIKNDVLWSAFISVSTASMKVNTLLEYPNGFMRKLAMKTIKYYAEKSKADEK